MLGKFKDKLNAVRFEFSFVVHMLQPWPSGNKSIAIGWQRGKRRRGATKSVYPSAAPGKLGNVVRFNEKFDVPSTLYKVNTSSNNNKALGPFKKKCIILAVLETDGRTQATAALGRIVIDLSEYAAADKQEMRTFHVACNKSIHAAVGEPLLTVTIRCRFRKIAAANGEAVFDDSASMSTDTTGSHLTANLNSLLRIRHSGRVENEEQDLKGFESIPKPLPDKPGFMEAIEESHDETPENLSTPQSVCITPTSLPSPISARLSGPLESPGPESRTPNLPRVSPTPHRGSATADGLNISQEALAIAASLARGSGSGRPPLPPGQEMSNGSSRGPFPKRNWESNGDMQPQRSYPSSSSLQASPRASQSVNGDFQNEFERMSVTSNDAATESQLLRNLQMELLSVAVMESAFHFAQVCPTRSPARHCHAPARRLARTLAALDPAEGAGLGRVAIRVLEGHSRAAKSEMSALGFWWTNAAHLRSLLLTLSGTEGIGGSVSWAAAELSSKLLRVERALFDEVLGRIWGGVLMPLMGTKTSKRATQEAALKRWLDGLAAVRSSLALLGEHGHLRILRRMLLMAILTRVDVTLLGCLFEGGAGSSLMLEYDRQGCVWGGDSPRSSPAVDDAALPFTRGTLTFGNGMALKMAVTRLAQSVTTAGDSKMPTVGLDPSQLFPLLRGAADLLMMPKDLLADRAIRSDVTASLTPRTVLHVAEYFKTDEFSHEPVPAAVLENLRQEFASKAEETFACSLSTAYVPPDPAFLAKQAEEQGEAGIAYGADSEDELEAIATMSGTSMDHHSARFRLLHELWSRSAGKRSSSVALKQ